MVPVLVQTRFNPGSIDTSPPPVASSNASLVKLTGSIVSVCPATSASMVPLLSSVSAPLTA